MWDYSFLTAPIWLKCAASMAFRLPNIVLGWDFGYCVISGANTTPWSFLAIFIVLLLIIPVFLFLRFTALILKPDIGTPHIPRPANFKPGTQTGKIDSFSLREAYLDAWRRPR